MTRTTTNITRSLAAALVMATLGAPTADADQDLRSPDVREVSSRHVLRTPDELDAARSLPPKQLAAVAEGLRSHPRSWDCELSSRSAP